MAMSNAKASSQTPSDRSFGLFFSCLFAVIALWLLLVSDRAALFLFAGLASCFLLLSIFSPGFLHPLNLAWNRLGLLLGGVVGPIVLGVIFFMLITPTSMITRLFGRDELRIKRREVVTYWVDRKPHGPAPQSFKSQF